MASIISLVKNSPPDDQVCLFERIGAKAVPLNDAAQLLCDLVGKTTIPWYRLDYAMRLGLNIKVRL